MNEAVFTTIAITGFSVAFMHAAIPTHWLPFVAAGRAQGWPKGRTLVVTAICGLGHVAFTAVLGALVAWFGIALSDRVGVWFPRIAGGALLAFGVFYLYRQWQGGGHGHSHLFGGHHGHGHSHEHDSAHAMTGETGTHGGPLVRTGHGAVELSVFEAGVPPRWRLYFVDASGRPSPLPTARTIAVLTIRPDQSQQAFSFREQRGFLESNEEIPEPHEFTAVLELRHDGHAHRYETPFVEHAHYDHGHGDEREHAAENPVTSVPASRAKSDWAALVSLFTLLTFSPCEGFLPVYITGVRHGWWGFALLTLILSFATVAGMVLFTWLTLLGLEKLKLRAFEKYESGLMGGLLCALGIIVIVFEH